jgi:DNA invertase Pin-like site-specific DNA recombinase
LTVFGTMPSMTRVGYARVSTREQNIEAQTDLLGEAGCEKVFIDKISGKLARRPRWDACLDYLRPGDQLVVTRLSRVARSVRHLSEVVAELQRREVDLVVLKQGLDTSSPAGRLLFHLMGAIDEFTADLISEGTLEGLAAARARGRVGGRAAVMTPTMVEVARRMFDAGHKPGEIARELRVGRTTVYRHLGTDPASGCSVINRT